MTKNSFFIFVMVLIIGFSIWFTQFGKDIKKTQDLVVEQQEKTQRVLRRQTAANTQDDKLSAERASEKAQLGSDLQALSVQLDREAQKLISLRASLENLKQQLSAKLVPNYTYQISDLNDEIRDLSNTLRDYQWSERDLDRQVNLALQEQGATLRVSVQQMEQNIAKQEQEIKAVQDELSYWIYNNGDMTKKDERVQYLEEALLNLSQALNDMKTQRAEVLTRSLEQSQNIQAQALAAASAINEDRYNIQEEVSSLRGEIKRLQYLQNQSRTNQFSLTAQVQQVEKNIQGQQDTVKTIEDLIHQKQEALKKLE